MTTSEAELLTSTRQRSATIALEATTVPALALNERFSARNSALAPGFESAQQLALR